ncbi:MAG: hypothetical protein C3F07_08440 [Anaerolineales bacterium]|nr:DUF1003 domain-containing protein [Anaerolineae bacterium]PWB74051.1 MAG: hypothetical protein C3F07_08440 [Anaerolineales bacterium]
MNNQEQFKNLFLEKLNGLTKREQEMIRRIIQRSHVTRNTNREFDEQLTFGQRLADRVASFGGSWTFIMIFASILLSWVILNSFILARYNKTFDPYPYILLNLFLSMLASIQAPIIMMSQNRQAAKDRLDAAHDYEINLKAELEIASLHAKMDELREKQWSELVAMQQEQIILLTKLLEKKNAG